jgi:hypothetical protein
MSKPVCPYGYPCNPCPPRLRKYDCRDCQDYTKKPGQGCWSGPPPYEKDEQRKTYNSQNNTSHSNYSSSGYSGYDNRDSHEKMNDHYRECYNNGTGAHEDCEM